MRIVFVMKKLAIVAIILSLTTIAGQIFLFATHKENNEDTYKKALQADYRVYSPVLPDTLSFCGERVPMETYYVREALDRELLTNMYWQSNTLIWMKRSARFFPTIEAILKKNGLPDDLKYLCVIESGLAPTGSSAGAQGYWQFMKATGQRYGLEVTDEIDMRNHLEQSTEAACQYLKSLYSHFGSWSMAAAAYNLGENGVSRRSESQEVSNYYDLKTPNETTRYVFRILAIKLMMQHPQEYGYFIRQCDLYPPIPTRKVTLSGQNIDMYAFAKSNGCSYKMLRDLNPWLQTDNLKNAAKNSYTIQVPIENGTRYTVVNKKIHDYSLVKSL